MNQDSTLSPLIGQSKHSRRIHFNVVIKRGEFSIGVYLDCWTNFDSSVIRKSLNVSVSYNRGRQITHSRAEVSRRDRLCRTTEARRIFFSSVRPFFYRAVASTCFSFNDLFLAQIENCRQLPFFFSPPYSHRSCLVSPRKMGEKKHYQLSICRLALRYILWKLIISGWIVNFRRN